MQLADIGNPTYIVLETFRKSGEGVKTPVWVAAEGGKLYVWTVDSSGKVKRIRSSGRVRLAVGDARGNPKSDWVEAQARVLADPLDVAKQEARISAKYGFQFKVFNLLSKVRRDATPHVAIEIGPA